MKSPATASTYEERIRLDALVEIRGKLDILGTLLALEKVPCPIEIHCLLRDKGIKSSACQQWTWKERDRKLATADRLLRDIRDALAIFER